jgi:hypothetical protein
MQVIGLCRFSYPAIGGFQRDQGTIDARKAYLYDRARLEHRFRLFETFCLPSIANQTDQGFIFPILIGDDLPDWAYSRLENLTRSIPMIKTIPRAPGIQRLVAADVINAERLPECDLCAQFRLDDDDAMNVLFVELLRELGPTLIALYPDAPMVGLDFHKGCTATVLQGEIFTSQVVHQYLTCAMACFVRHGVHQTCMNFKHHKIYEIMPTVSDGRFSMFIRSLHHANDSNALANNGNKPFDPPSSETAAWLQDLFGIDTQKVKEIWRDFSAGRFAKS